MKHIIFSLALFFSLFATSRDVSAQTYDPTNPPPANWCYDPNGPGTAFGGGGTRDLKPGNQQGPTPTPTMISSTATDGYADFYGCSDGVGTNGHGGPYLALGSGANRYCHSSGMDMYGYYWTHAVTSYDPYYLMMVPQQFVPLTCEGWYQPHPGTCNNAGWMHPNRINAARLGTGSPEVQRLIAVSRDPKMMCHDKTYAAGTCGTGAGNCCNNYTDGQGYTWWHYKNATGTCSSYREAIAR
jgi:hypothetical protein